RPFPLPVGVSDTPRHSGTIESLDEQSIIGQGDNETRKTLLELSTSEGFFTPRRITNHFELLMEQLG
ncbi:MAG: hypothetical protein ACE5JL_19150, partial [Dehalococcoidia bacterium]